MQTYNYPAIFEAGDEGGFVVSFPNVPGAFTDGPDRGRALAAAADVLGLALLTFAREGKALPPRWGGITGAPLLRAVRDAMRSAEAEGGFVADITPAPDVAAKLAVVEAFKAAGISQSEFARRLGRDEKIARRILDPMHETKLPALQAALSALGRRLVIGVEIIEDAA